MERTNIRRWRSDGTGAEHADQHRQLGINNEFGHVETTQVTRNEVEKNIEYTNERGRSSSADLRPERKLMIGIGKVQLAHDFEIGDCQDGIILGMDFIMVQVSEMNFEDLTMKIGEKQIELILYDKTSQPAQSDSCKRHDHTSASRDDHD